MNKQGKIAMVVAFAMVALFLLSFAFAAPKQCNDGLDNDGDTFTDYPADPGCSSSADNSELNSSVQCDDNLDNDLDSLVDYPDDTGCTSPNDTSELPGGRACNDGIDNDGDTKTDYPSDLGCANSTDNSELNPSVQCDNGVDDADTDSLADWPSDPGCSSLSDTNEVDGQCDNGFDDVSDNDTLADLSDPGCTSTSDQSEIDGQCDDQVNNDGDGLVDKAFDPECILFGSNEWNCTDSDGGIFPNVAGDILGSTGGTPYQTFDTCLDSVNLTEYYCGYPWTGVQSVLKNCDSPANGTTQCVSGQCIA